MNLRHQSPARKTNARLLYQMTNMMNSKKCSTISSTASMKKQTVKILKNNRKQTQIIVKRSVRQKQRMMILLLLMMSFSQMDWLNRITISALRSKSCGPFQILVKSWTGLWGVPTSSSEWMNWSHLQAIISWCKSCFQTADNIRCHFIVFFLDGQERVKRRSAKYLVRYCDKQEHCLRDMW